MSRFTIFIGGVHGVGKGYLCRLLQQNIFCDYVSVSALLHWTTKDKTVENVQANQDLLTVLLPNAIQADKTFLIDGHYAILNKNGGIEPVPNKVFDACKPNVLIVVADNPDIIVERLKKRDNLDYDAVTVGRNQDVEIDVAKSISKALRIPLFIIRSFNDNDIKKMIKEIKDSMSEYTRDNIYSEMLKTVIIRFDYSGGTDIRKFVDTIKQDDLIRNAFGSLQRIDAPKYRLSMSQIDPQTGLFPTAERQQSVLYRFSECKYDSGLNVILDITPESVCLTIDCRSNYQGSKRYTDLMSKLVTQMKSFDQFISVERIGVRKIDAQIIGKEDKIENYFNENFIALNSWRGFSKDKVNHAEFFKIGKVHFNVVQYIDRIQNSTEDGTKEFLERAIYDVDAFIVNGDINEIICDEKTLTNFLDSEMQDKMFELFVSVASKSYLEKCKVAKQQQNG